MSAPAAGNTPRPGGPRHFARTEGSARIAAPQAAAITPASEADRRLVQASFAAVLKDPQAAMEYLYARLFAASPALRSLFPLGMTQTRAATFRMLARLIAGLDDQEATASLLSQLARDHRKFGVRDKHYEPFFEALAAMAEHAAGQEWTAQQAAAWRAVLDHFADVMAEAAAQDAQDAPAWWTGEIVQHDRRTQTIAVLTIRPDQPLSYLPGQYVPVQVPRWPRVWRAYSIANAPRDNGLLDIHVRAVPAGMVSTALVRHCRAGDTVLLGAARGDLRVVPGNDRDLVCVAGGTGLAPLKAIAEAVIGASRVGRRREVTMYVGVRHSSDLYDMRDLETLRLAYPSLTLIPVSERELDFAGRVGKLPEVVAAHPSFRSCDVYIAGPAGLVASTVQALSRRVPADRLHHDPLDALTAASRPLSADYLSRQDAPTRRNNK